MWRQLLTLAVRAQPASPPVLAAAQPTPECTQLTLHGRLARELELDALNQAGQRHAVGVARDENQLLADHLEPAQELQVGGHVGG